jgi:alpha-1,6-mannosyltransferase
MKIIDVAEFYADQGGGVKTYINQKLQAGARMGHEVVIVAPGRESREEERFGGRIIWVKGPRLPVDPRYVILWRRRAIHRILDREKPDIVEGSSPWTGGHFASSWKGNAVKTFIFHQDPVAVYPHTMLGRLMSVGRVDKVFRFYWNFLKRLSNRFDATIVSGEWLAERVAGFGVKNPIAVPFGIDKAFFSPSRRDPALRKSLLESLGLPENAHLFMGISRHHPEKRLGTIIEGFQKVADGRPVGLLLFGDGPFRKYVAYKANKAANVKIMGFTSNRDELANILASCDYFVHGSAAETYGLVVAEAICSGLPVIVPNFGGAADLADPGYAETYTAGAPKEFAEAIIRMLNRNRDDMVKACAKAAESKIGTMDTHFKQLFEVYAELLAKKKSKK